MYIKVDGELEQTRVLGKPFPSVGRVWIIVTG